MSGSQLPAPCPATLGFLLFQGVDQSLNDRSFPLIDIMICEHLRPLEQAIAARGIRETWRGKPWSLNCREWVFFDCYIDTDGLRQSFPLPACITAHAHRGTHDGEERGFVCSECQDAIMGRYEAGPGVVIFRG